MNFEEAIDLLGEDRTPNFCVYLDFPPDVVNPQRLFQVAANYITALQSLDAVLVKSIDSEIQTVLLLEEIKAGSLKIFLKQALSSIDDENLRNMEWKPQVGKYLVKAKHCLLRKLSENNGLPQKEQLKALSGELHRLARETEVKRLPVYRAPSVEELAEGAKNISEALRPLKDGETVFYVSDDGEAQLDASFIVVQEDITTLLAERTIENKVEMILMIRKPDFLGESRWEFRYQKRNLAASIEDEEWLEEFQKGEIDIRPGYALHVMMKEVVSYSSEGEVVEERRAIAKVIEVIKQSPPVQGRLI